jgi:hypothetical protein
MAPWLIDDAREQGPRRLDLLFVAALESIDRIVEPRAGELVVVDVEHAR